MTEEMPLNDVNSYKFPDKYFEKLESLEDNSPKYGIVQGGLYDTMRQDTRFSNKDAAEVSRLLNKAEVSEAKDLVYEVLE